MEEIFKNFTRIIPNIFPIQKQHFDPNHLQKQWSKVLTDLYGEVDTPVWFIGAPNLIDSFSGLDQALSSALAVSSSGGSGGGGSSGGGGGGGGGGGI